jgi:type I restriction enzyme S subunit
MGVMEPSAKYLTRPGYKQTQVGIIPKDWDIGTLGSFWDVTDCKHVTARFTATGYPVASIMEVQKRFVDLSTAKHTTQRFYNLLIEGGRKPRVGDLILSRNATVGEVAQVAEWHPLFAMGQDVCLLRKKSPRFSTNYLQAVFGSDIVGNQLSDLMVGSTFKRVNVEQIRNLIVPMPPPAEQQIIAAALSDADALVECLEQLLAKKCQLKQGAMQELLTGKRRLPGFTGEWEVKALGELFSFTGGVSASRDQLSTEGHCYLHYGDIHTSSKSFIDVCSEYQSIPKLEIPLKKVPVKSLLADGDAVFVDASEDDEGASKHVVVVNPGGIPFISGLHTIVAKSRTGELDHQYRRFCFQTRAMKAQFRFFAVGTKVSGISKANIAKVTMPVPSIVEQAAIAAILSDMDADLAALESKLAKARSVKQGVMQELLMGRIRLIESAGAAEKSRC